MDDLDQLPEGWEWRQIGDVILDAQAGFSSGQKDVPGGIPHLRMNNITSECTLDLSELRTVPPDLAKARHFLRPDDVLVCHTNSVKLVGKTALYDATGGERAFSNHLTRLRVKPDLIHPHWLWRGITVLWRDRYFETRCKKWVNQATIQRDVLLAAPVPVPPLPEQQRLVEKIERLLEQSRTAREALNRIQPLLKRFRQSVLAKAFRGELTQRDPNDEPASILLERIREERRQKWEEDLRARGKDSRKAKYVEPEAPDTSGLPGLPEGWVWASMGQLAEVSTGATPLRSKKKAYYDGGTIPWIKSGALNDDPVMKAEEFVTELALEETNTKIFPRETLLVAMYGEGQTRGRVSELGIEGATNQACAAMLFSAAASGCKAIVKYYFRKTYEDIRLLSAGGVQPNLNLSLVRRTSLPLAPLAEQRRIVARIETSFSEVEAIERSVARARRLAEHVDQAVLARAFRGEL